MGKPEVTRTDSFMNSLLDEFETLLVRLKLSEEQIRNQTLEELQNSLDNINELIRSPNQVRNYKFTVTGNILLSGSTEATIGILPLLLERRQLIQDRIRLLKGEQKATEVEEIVRSVTDDSVREEVTKVLTEMQAELDRLRKEAIESASINWEQRLREEAHRAELAEKNKRLEAELADGQGRRRTEIFQAYLRRDTIATLVGAVLLFILTIILVLAAFTNHQVPDILNNSFLIILGYFFGQSVARAEQDNRQQKATPEGNS